MGDLRLRRLLLRGPSWSLEDFDVQGVVVLLNRWAPAGKLQLFSFVDRYSYFHNQPFLYFVLLLSTRRTFPFLNYFLSG